MSQAARRGDAGRSSRERAPAGAPAAISHDAPALSPVLSPAERWRAIVVSTAVLGATLWPLTWPLGADSFPLSPYPMFSRTRGRELSLLHAVGIDAGGARTPLSPMIAVENREVLQSLVTLRRAVTSGRAAAQCEAIASRIPSAPELDAVEQVELATDTFDVVAYFEDELRAPLASDVHARCSVLREPR